MIDIDNLCSLAPLINNMFRNARVHLSQPVCTNEGEQIAISRRIDRAWRLIGWGDIKKGVKIPLGDEN